MGEVLEPGWSTRACDVMVSDWPMRLEADGCDDTRVWSKATDVLTGEDLMFGDTSLMVMVVVSLKVDCADGHVWL